SHAQYPVPGRTTVRISLPNHNVKEQKRPDRKFQSVKQILCFGQAFIPDRTFVSVRQGDLYMVTGATVSSVICITFAIRAVWHSFRRLGVSAASPSEQRAPSVERFLGG
ncbi:hypothetical protein, partial [Pseudokordiimonas caeni]|uniref:hypothetical protein n=1 Tax=Pseudokordiimonas caeni TaxID=2997908 RepID=UPI002810A3DF